MSSKKFRSYIKRKLAQIHNNLEWALAHMADIEWFMRSAAKLGDEPGPLSEEEIAQLPVIWQQLVRYMRVVAYGIMTAQEELRKYHNEI